MNLSQVEYFATAARTLSFSQAAQELFVSQQAVSKGVALLEAQLGTPLFERTASGLRLTRAGLDAQMHANALLADARNLAMLSKHASMNEKVVLRLAVSDVVLGDAYDITLADLQAFRTANPSYDLQVMETTSDEARRLVEAGDVSAAVVAGHTTCPSLLHRCVLRDEAVAFVGAGHRLAAAARVSLADLADETFLIPRGARASMEEMRYALYCAGVDEPSPEQFVFPNCTPRLLMEQVYAGAGVAFIARRNLKFLDPERARILPLESNPCTLALSVIVRRPLVAGSGIEALRNHLIHLFEQRYGSLEAPGTVSYSNDRPMARPNSSSREETPSLP